MSNENNDRLKAITAILENDLRIIENESRLQRDLFIHKIIIIFLICSIFIFSKPFFKNKEIIKCLENNPTFTLTQCKQK